jgi:hypothetical protein
MRMRSRLEIRYSSEHDKLHRLSTGHPPDIGRFVVRSLKVNAHTEGPFAHSPMLGMVNRTSATDADPI